MFFEDNSIIIQKFDSFRLVDSDYFNQSSFSCICISIFFCFSLNVSIWTEIKMRTQPFEVEKIEIRFSDSPQSLFTVNRMFSRWPMTTISALLFAFRGLGRGCSSSSRYQTRSLLLWIDLRRHGTLNVVSRHPSTLLRPQEVNLKEEFGS